MNTLDPGRGSWAPATCTLPLPERPLRRAEFTSLFAASLRSLERIDETHLRLVLTGGADLAAMVADLTARETECCSFFEFTITESADQILLDVVVPAVHTAVLDGLARHAAETAGLAA